MLYYTSLNASLPTSERRSRASSIACMMYNGSLRRR